MDYKYIEQLLLRYWECETTLQEERILQAFFSQKDIPEHLMQYRNIFMAVTEEKDEHLGKDFDERILKMAGIQEEAAKTRKISLSQRLRPLYRSAAVVAMVLTIGMAAEHSFQETVADTDSSMQIAEDPDAEYTQMPQGMVPETSAAADNSIKPLVDSLVKHLPDGVDETSN